MKESVARARQAQAAEQAAATIETLQQQVAVLNAKLDLLLAHFELSLPPAEGDAAESAPNAPAPEAALATAPGGNTAAHDDGAAPGGKPGKPGKAPKPEKPAEKPK